MGYPKKKDASSKAAETNKSKIRFIDKSGVVDPYSNIKVDNF